jgi:hypothetical protein
MEGVLVAKPGCRMTVKSAPMHLEFVEERDEEFRARQMHVAVGDSHPMLIDGDHQDVRIGRADVVLDHETRLATNGGGIEPRVVEFEPARALKPAHEGGDEWLILGVKTIGERAGNALLGALRGHAVERFVQIHHQAVQAVGFAYRGELGDTGFSHALGAKIERSGDRIEALLGRYAGGCVSSTHRLDHRLDVGEQRLVQLG